MYDKDKHTFCVNALNGLLLISSTVVTQDMFNKNVCQCPQRASTYFFVAATLTGPTGDKCVNALNGLLLISSEAKLEAIKTERKCVNALNGLLLISSVPSQNP